MTSTRAAVRLPFAPDPVAPASAPAPTRLPMPMPTLVSALALAVAAVVATFPARAADPAEAAIRKALAARLPDLKIDEIAPAPVPGLYELRSGTEVFYADARGDYVIQGAIIDTKTRADLTQARVDKLAAIDVSALPLQDALVWKQGTGERRIVVFADPNCGYCKKFETDLQQVKDLTVYTFLMPILGGDSPAKSRDIWCARDNAQVWRNWMVNGSAIPRSMGACDASALTRNVALGKKYRINGTPSVIFADGKRVPGALPLAELEKQLAASRAKS